MACHWKRFVILLGAVAVAATPARAQDDPKKDPEPKPKPRTVVITECVEEKYEVKRPGYRIECRPKVVEGFRYEVTCVPRDQVCTVVRRVPVQVQEVRKVCCPTWCWQERVVMKPCYEYRQVTKCVKKCVSRGHWECRTECAKPGLLERLCHRNDCCDPCGNGCEPCCRVRTRKVWVNCPVYVDCPVTCCQKVCVHKPVVCRVKVCKTVVKEVPVTVCRIQCVEEKVTQRVYERVCRKVACQTTVMERVCVPCEQTVICTRLVPRQREVEVVETAPCCVPCVPCCNPCGNGRHGLCGRQHRCCY